jgi:hypothetical protein
MFVRKFMWVCDDDGQWEKTLGGSPLNMKISSCDITKSHDTSQGGESDPKPHSSGEGLPP